MTVDTIGGAPEKKPDPGEAILKGINDLLEHEKEWKIANGRTSDFDRGCLYGIRMCHTIAIAALGYMRDPDADYGEEEINLVSEDTENYEDAQVVQAVQAPKTLSMGDRGSLIPGYGARMECDFCAAVFFRHDLIRDGVISYAIVGGKNKAQCPHCFGEMTGEMDFQ